jgi:glycolate oxidase iron-sulfur subunit
MEATLTPALARPRPAAEAPHLRAAWENAESWCIKCGFCLPACPTYRETGVEASSPRGRLDLMYAVASGRLPLEAAEHQMWFCLGCQACETACPSGIRYHDILEAARFDSAARRARGSGAWRRRFLLRVVLPSPALLRGVVGLLALYRRSGLQRLVRGTRLLRLIPPLARLEARMPPIAFPVRWRGALAEAPAAVGAPGRPARAALLTGCVMDAAFGAVHAATVRVLARNGIRTDVPTGQGCCGALHLHAGDERAARDLARRNIAAFEAAGDEAIVVNSAGCGALLKDYGRLLAAEPAWRERAERFSRRVLDVSEFLAGLALVPPGPLPLRVAYDDPCHLLHAQQVREPPRQVLGQIPGLILVPLREADMCCGGAGSYAVTQPEMSTRLLNRKLDHIAASGAEAVATGNPGCLLQLRMGVESRGLAVRVVHPVELLAEAYGRR